MGLTDYELTIVAVFLAGILVPQIISIVVYHLVLGALPAKARLISARSTFILLIPFVSTVYEFYVVLRLSRSLIEYFEAVGEREMGACGRGFGVAFCVFNAGAIIPVVGFGFGIVGLLLWIVYMLTVLDLRKAVLRTKARYRPTAEPAAL